MAGLDGARIKLNRSAHHIEELRAAATQFLKSKPYELVQSEDSQGDLVFTVRVLKTIPPEWAAIVGDAVHNLRSALDLLAWQLVELNGAQATRDTCFPITSSAGALEGALKRALSGARPSALRLVRRLRPHAGGNTKLQQLHSLDIVDKHRLVLIVGAAHKHVVMRTRIKVHWQDAPVEFPSLALTPADRQFPLADGAEVFRVKAAARHGDVHSEHQAAFELAFGDGTEVKGLPLVLTLEEMHRYVSRIVEMCNDLFFS